MTDFAQARRAGSYRRDGMLIQRMPALKAGEVLLGKACEITFAASVVVPGRYAIVESHRLQPSHAGGVENPFYFIPEAQPRNRATSRSGALLPELAARNVRPAEVTEGATAYAGAPIVNPRGEVIQGKGFIWNGKEGVWKATYKAPRWTAVHRYFNLPEPQAELATAKARLRLLALKLQLKNKPQ